MGVPKKVSKLNQDRLKFIDTKADNLELNIEDQEDQMFKKVVALLFTQIELDDNGNIKRTAKNIQVVSKFSTIRSMIITPAYLKQVEIYLKSFDQVADKTNNYFKALPENA